MKKTLVSALTAALAVGAASTAFAASNPFSDVPQGHWAYDAVSQLAADGVIEGYGDGTYQGDKTITRYEMAQMVAKAMAKESSASAADKALIDKLAAEYADELNNLGVRVSNLERNADMVKWNGEMRYTYAKQKADGQDNTSNEFKFRLEPSAEVNSHWHVRSRLDATTNASEDGESNVSLKRLYADGDYSNWNIKLGKLPEQIDGNLFDTQLSGGAIAVGNDLKFTVEGGRMNLGRNNLTNDLVNEASATDHKADAFAAGLQYTKDKFSMGAGYHYLSSDAFKVARDYNTNGETESKATIWTGNMKYRFDKNVALGGSYARNTAADHYDKAGTVELDYKGAEPANRGTWGAYAAYRYLGDYAAIAPTYMNGDLSGARGWEFGTNYTVAKNTVLNLKYFKGKALQDSSNASEVFGRVQFFF